MIGYSVAYYWFVRRYLFEVYDWLLAFRYPGVSALVSCMSAAFVDGACGLDSCPSYYHYRVRVRSSKFGDESKKSGDRVKRETGKTLP